MSRAEFLTNYVDAFNRNETEIWSACYAPDIVFRNGAGTCLHGRDAVVDYYTDFRGKAQRTMTIRGICEGEHALAAALHSRFTALVDGLELAGHRLRHGEGVEIDSVALYEMRGERFSRIEATTISRRLLPMGVA